jgi:aspartyl-tRNA(Asn)/glutamyl-tRNA(Gln) amidotransferase subunit B
MVLRMSNQYGIDQKMAKQLVTTSVGLARLFESVANKYGVQNAVKWVAGPVSANWASAMERDVSDEDIMSLVSKFADGSITDTECAIELKCLMTGESKEDACNASGDLDAIIEGFIEENPGIVADYAKNDKAANKAIGFVMKSTGGKYSSAEVVEAVKRIIESKL